MLIQLANSLTNSAAGPLLATPSMNIPVAIVLFFILLGLGVTLSPARRTHEVKRRRED